MRQRVNDETESYQLSDVTSMTEINLPHPTALKRLLRLGDLVNITPKISPQKYCS